MNEVRCGVCPRGCVLAPGQVGACRARAAQGGRVVPLGYGRVTALALDDVEKKPLRRFMPGGKVLSVGSFGCNLRCPFCQNHAIAQTGAEAPTQALPPDALANMAVRLRSEGNVGLAFTYNEPVVGWEYVADAADAARLLGLKTVLVTNGYAEEAVWRQLCRRMAAMNVDVKCFTEEGYRRLGGQLAPVQRNIAAALAAEVHVEVSSLVVPGLNDDPGDMARQAAWLAGLSPEVPLHLARYFPRWRATAPPTPPGVLHQLAAVAGAHLRHVYLGNV